MEKNSDHFHVKDLSGDNFLEEWDYSKSVDEDCILSQKNCDRNWLENQLRQKPKNLKYSVLSYDDKAKIENKE